MFIINRKDYYILIPCNYKKLKLKVDIYSINKSLLYKEKNRDYVYKKTKI